jgi:tetratricopeptide (TPR) repeat protein
MQSVAEGDDANGYRVTLKAPGSNDLTFFVVKENGQYKLLDSNDKPNAIGLEILDRVNAGNLDGARVLLDWIRESQHLSGGDDPLEGFSFARLWTKGKPGDATQEKIAAAALICQSKPTAAIGLSILEPALPNAKEGPDKTNLLMALRDGYWATNNYEKQLGVSNELAAQFPDSENAFANQEWALRGLRRFDEANALANKRLAKTPDDVEAQRMLIRSAVAAEDYETAHAQGLKLIAGPKAIAGDLNGVAWNGLFVAKKDPNDMDVASRAVALTQNNNAGIMHTLGCVTAEFGKPQQAREILVQGMDLANLDEPESNYWYGFGRVAEQYGENQVAIADYNRVEKPEHAQDIPGSSYKLAQTRLAAIKGSASATKTK